MKEFTLLFKGNRTKVAYAKDVFDIAMDLDDDELENLLMIMVTGLV